jgi:hypothetical protein
MFTSGPHDRPIQFLRPTVVNMTAAAMIRPVLVRIGVFVGLHVGVLLYVLVLL